MWLATPKGMPYDPSKPGSLEIVRVSSASGIGAPGPPFAPVLSMATLRVWFSFGSKTPPPPTTDGVVETRMSLTK